MRSNIGMRWRIDLDEVEAVREAKQMRGGRVLPPSKRDWDWYTEGRAKKSRRGDPGDRKVGERGEVKMVGWMKVENQDERERGNAKMKISGSHSL